MGDVDIEKIIEEQKILEEEFLSETYENINKLQEQIDKEGLVDTSVFIELMACYGTLTDKIEVFELPDKYMQMAYDRATEDIRFKRNTGSAYICLGKYSQLKKYNDKALFYYNKAIESEPDNADFYVIRGSYFRSVKKLKEANADYKKALSLKPDDVTLQILCKKDFSEPSKFKEVLTIIAIVACVILSILAEIY